MVGNGNCCSISIEDMDDQRRLAPILGKLVNRMGELKSNAAVADGGFKKLVSTGDSISVEKKFKDIIEYTPVAKHVIATNNLPTVNDRSKATFNRMLLIKFNHSIPKKDQNTDVYDRIQEQLPQLVAWALIGAERLYLAQGKFTRVASSEAEINEYKRRENPLLEFIEDYCVPDPKCNIPRDHFQAQLKARGLDKYKTPTALTRDLKSLGIHVEKVRCLGYRDMGAVRSVVGYRFREQAEETRPFTVGEDGMVLVN
jgi:putative DNA primase/helicase